MSRLHELRQALGAAVDELPELASDQKAYDEKEAEILALEKQIERVERANQRAASLARPVGQEEGASPPGDTAKFANLGDQLVSVVRHYNGGGTDQRLVRAPVGAGETDPTSGGFLVQTDFANTILQRAYDLGEISQRIMRLPISPNSNGIKIPGIDETSRATGSRWGGVQAYWVGEGDAAAATKPKFRLIELDLKKLMAVMYISDELLSDTTALTAIATQAFSEEFMFMIEDSVLRGSGAGQPLGVLRSPAKIAVQKESGQAANSIVYQNIVNMWARMWARSRANAVWFINQDIEPQLYTMSQVIGTAGVPVYLPANGISGQAYGTLFGRPVVPIEYGETLGTEGDILLADFSQYVMADKQGVQQATSLHVRFLTDEMTLRITYRCDGEPTWHAPLSPYKGTASKSPFITLATRS